MGTYRPRSGRRFSVRSMRPGRERPNGVRGVAFAGGAGAKDDFVFEATGDQSRKVMALASRLRLVQAELADERSEVRQEQLDGEIERVLAVIQPAEREEFLRELMRSFPGGNGEVVKAGAPAPAVQSGPSLPKDPAALAEFVTDALLKNWGSLGVEQKKALTAKLTQGGVVAPSAGGGGGTLPENVVRDLRGKLQLGSTESPDAARVSELAAMTVDFVMGVDRLVWGMWSRKISPMSAIRSTGPMQRFMREYVTGKIDPLQSGTGGGPAGDMRRLLEMTVAVVSALGQAGTSFGDRFVSQYSPGAIEETVGEGGFRNKDAECWKIYKASAAKLDRGSIDAEITQSIARFVEDWMKRAGR